MRFIKRIGIILRESFYGPTRYARVAKGTALAGVKYAFFAATIGVVSFGTMLLIGVFAFSGVDLSRDAIDRVYPEGLEITIKDGVASTNQAEPILVRTDDMITAFNLPPNLRRVEGVSTYEHMLVIDTTRTLTLDDVEAYNAWSVLGSTAIYTHDDEGGISVQPLRGTSDDVITEAAAIDMLESIRPIIVWGVPFVIITIGLFFVLFFGIFLLALAAPASLVVKLIARFQGFTVSYSGAYAVSLLAMVAVCTVGTIFGLLHINLPFIVDVILFCALVIANLKPRATSPEASASAEVVTSTVGGDTSNNQ